MHLLKIFNVLFWALLVFLSMPGNYTSIVFIAFVPCFYILKQKKLKNIFIMGACAGILAGVLIYRGFSLYSNLIYIYSIIFLALHFGLFLVVSKKYGIFSGMMFYIVFEFIRTLGRFGIPSNLALSFYQYSSVIKIASIGGIYIISLYIMIINFTIYDFIFNFRKKRKYLGLIALIGLTLLNFAPLSTSSNGDLKVAVIQGGIPDWMYSMEYFDRTFNETIEKSYMELTESVVKKTDLIVWPETAIKDFIFSKNKMFYTNYFKLKSQEQNVNFIIGTPHLENNGTETNSIFFIEKGNFYRYDKIDTVPIVEDHFVRGKVFDVMKGEKYNFIPVICFESIFERNIIRKQPENADFIVVTTNDAGFRHSILKHTHAAYSVFRAVETGKPLIRAAQSGISMIIDSEGRILKKLDKFQSAVLEGKINTTEGTTVFAEYYSIIISFYFLLCGAGIFYALKKGKQNNYEKNF
ncbi:MAG: nitrilase-related carbon-nitrogen hydrolase [Candidatus Muiribacteriota bacterium]